MDSLTQTLPINSLDFPDIRENFISYLKSQVDNQGNPIYQDYNFAASRNFKYYQYISI